MERKLEKAKAKTTWLIGTLGRQKRPVGASIARAATRAKALGADLDRVAGTSLDKGVGEYSMHGPSDALDARGAEYLAQPSNRNFRDRMKASQVGVRKIAHGASRLDAFVRKSIPQPRRKIDVVQRRVVWDLIGGQC